MTDKSLSPEQIEKRMDEALAAINKLYGNGSIVRLSSRIIEDMDVIPTGIPSIDQVVAGVGGMPLGRIVEIFGPESSGKTTITLMIIGEAQKLGNKCAFVDAEHALDLRWAEKMGVDTGELLISQPDNGEQALDITRKLIESGAVKVIVVDSVAALVPQAELDGEIGDSHVGRQARLMSQSMRILSGAAKRNNVLLIFINQIREKIGVMFGSPETTTGGRALKFYASIRLDIRRAGGVKVGETIIGSRIKVKGVKNKVASPFRETEFDLIYDNGPDRVGNLLEFAVQMNLVDKSGAWFTYDGTRVQGMAKLREFFDANPESYNKLYTEYKEKLNA